MKKLVSGIKPTGKPHLGNYFGMLKQLLELENEYNSHVFIADYHALTTMHSKKELEESTYDLMVLLLAIGINPKKTTLYRQSAIPEVQELAWILSSLYTVPTLMRSHAYKDAEAKGKDLNVATFNYPILMAADILLSDADIVPVGKDQIQHVEITRELANKFNNTYIKIFKEPKELIQKETQVVPGIDGNKMGKSENNSIPLIASDKELREIVMSIPTDSKGVDEPKDPDTNNIYKLHSLILNEEEKNKLREKYKKPGLSYKEAKEDFLNDLINFISPVREKYKKMHKNRKKVISIYKRGEKEMRKKTKQILENVRKNVGL